MKYTKSHFEHVAKKLRDFYEANDRVYERDVIYRLAKSFADDFEENNEQFDREKFAKATFDHELLIKHF